jgi:hypothetical protein
MSIFAAGPPEFSKTPVRSLQRLRFDFFKEIGS